MPPGCFFTIIFPPTMIKFCSPLASRCFIWHAVQFFAVFVLVYHILTLIDFVQSFILFVIQVFCQPENLFVLFF